MKNYKAAVENYEKIALIYSKNKKSSEYKNAKQSIKSLQQNIKDFLEADTQEGDFNKGFLGDLKKTFK